MTTTYQARVCLGVIGSIITACSLHRILRSWTGFVVLWWYDLEDGSSLLLFFEGIVLLLCTVLGLVFVHISSLTWSDHLDASSVYLIYQLSLITKIVSFFTIKSFKNQTKKFMQTQEKYILHGLRYNQTTVYGNEFHLGDIHSLEEFKTRHPLTTYSHYEKYVDRICAGETHVMTKDDVVRLALTSGTTGKGKKIPYTNQTVWGFGKPIIFLAPSISKKTLSPGSPFQRTLNFHVRPKSLPSESGISVQAGSTISPSHKKYLLIYSTPISGFEISNEFEACYVHLLFGIRDRFLKSMTVLFTPLLITAFKILETHWEQMLTDIERGSLWSKLNIPVEVRADLEEKLKGVTFASERYVGTEGFYGVNLTILRPPPHRYTLVPDSLLFEFIPIEESEKSNANAFFGDQVKVGQTYELVVSNWTCGLYRFRFGDVIKVVDFYNEAPVVEFQYRYGQLMNLRGEKVDEVCMRKALENTFKQFSGITLIEYACAESLLMPDSAKRQGPHYYVVFVEVEGNKGDIGEHISTLLDAELCEHGALYKMWRSQNGIGTADVVFVKPGGFARLKNYIVDNSTATFNQFKQPRKLKTEGTVAFILGQASD
ncbi:uncharacterized protein [Antedon mediterranea]|uniref:uncharacterized protein isoform X2 n=1 Tax=Antedon mediterranea TaxID=105859 RepID=UPI003AF4BD33